MVMSQIGLGLYTLADVARLIQVQPRDVKRWMFGYDFKTRHADGGSAQHRSKPLWRTQYAGDPDLAEAAIGFRDLLELRIVREFVRCGVHLVVIRKCLETAKALFDRQYPFTAKRFLTDGRTVFLQAAEDVEAEFLDLKSLQFAIREVIRPSLYAGIEYQDGEAARWYPESNRRKSRSIVVDPVVQFGKPVLAESSVPTEAVYLAYRAEGGEPSAIERVAKIYELPTKEVQAAVRFEASLMAA
jgi:uncharacterized protein (DUF433 family)